MKKKTIVLITALMCALISPSFGQERIALAVIDISTDKTDAASQRALNDIFRTELFKTGLFDLVERGKVLKILMEQSEQNLLLAETDLVKIGQALEVQKILTARFFTIDGQTVLNCSMVDIATQKIEYTENIFSKENSGVVFTVKELVEKVSTFYKASKLAEAQNLDEGGVVSQWKLLGASDGNTDKIIKHGGTLKQYYQIRQYDIRFTTDEYLSLLESQSSFEILESFLKAGVRYEEYKKSMRLGIYSMAAYEDNFAPLGISYSDYLHSYENQIYSGREYLRFSKVTAPGRLNLGLGGVASEFPVENAQFKMMMFQVSYEHYFSSIQRGSFKWSPEVGLFMMQGILPTPFVDVNAYVGKFPLYAKFGVGGYYEFIKGGHGALFFNAGCEVNQILEIRYMIIATGSQPKLSYVQYQGKYIEKGEPNYDKVDITFPVMGVFFTAKLPARRR